MKMTLSIPVDLVRELKRRAARRGDTLAAVVVAVIRRGLEERPAAEVLPLGTHRIGRPRVSVADRNALYAAMED